LDHNYSLSKSISVKSIKFKKLEDIDFVELPN